MSLLYHNDTIIKKEKELLRALLSQFCKLAFILSALILAVLFNMCFVYGCWYFNAKSVLEVIVFIIGLIVLRRDTLRSSALMGTISIVLAVLLDMVIPFHFG